MLKKFCALAICYFLQAGFTHAQNCTTYPNMLANGQNADATQVMANFDFILNCLNQTPQAVERPGAPQGRISLVSGTPVMTSTQAGKTTVYYTPYAGQNVPIYDGTNFTSAAFDEVVQATNDMTKSPAAVIANRNYDIFCWVDTGTNRCTRGSAWNTDIDRGSGPGTTEIARVKGLWLNANTITNGPAAQRGTYVGTIRSNNAALVDWIFGSVAPTCGFASFGVWNAFNRVDVSTFLGDSTDTWTYAAATFRAANNSVSCRTSFVRGLDEDSASAFYGIPVLNNTSTVGYIGIGVDSVTSFSGRSGRGSATGSINSYATASYAGLPGLGFHFISAVEAASNSSANVAFYGDNNLPAFLQSGLTVNLRQ